MRELHGAFHEFHHLHQISCFIHVDVQHAVIRAKPNNNREEDANGRVSQ